MFFDQDEDYIKFEYEDGTTVVDDNGPLIFNKRTANVENEIKHIKLNSVGENVYIYFFKTEHSASIYNMWVDCIYQYDESKDDNMLQTTVDEIKIGMFQLWIKYLCQKGIVYKTGISG